MPEIKRNPFLNKLHYYFSKTGFAFFLLGNAFWYYFKKSKMMRYILLLFIIGLAVFFSYFQTPTISKDSSDTLIEIPPGATLRQISDSLHSKNLLPHRNLFLFFGKITGKEQNMRAGLFRIPEGLNSWQLLNYLEKAPSEFVKVTLPEGILSFEMGRILQNEVGIDSAKFVSLVYDSAFARQFNIEVHSLEGFLLPETYYFYWKIPEREIVSHMVRSTLRILNADSVRRQLQMLQMNPLESLTLASIIEGEAQVDSERVIISSVYHNRLKKGWRLQADPTVQFIIPDAPRRLTYKDLEIDSPYNTYLYPGLPPSPVNNPGKASILAAIFPAQTNFLYFVAAGDGSHRFSKTADEHAYWKQKFDKVRHRVRIEQRQQGK